MADYGFGRGPQDDFGRLVSEALDKAWLHRSLIWKVALAVAAVIVLFTSYYQIEPDEVGVVTRYARFHRVVNPGPHLRLPLGIERVQKVPVERQLKQEFGFRTVRSGGGVGVPQGREDLGRGDHADRRSQRRHGRVDRAVQDLRSLQVPVQAARRGGDLPHDDRGGHAPGGRRPQRDRAVDRGPRGHRLAGQGDPVRDVPAVTTTASSSSNWCCRTWIRPSR